jgi:hypothetical protein
MIALPAATAIFDNDYREAAGLAWMLLAPILKMSLVFSIISIIACFILAYFTDKEYQKAKTNG